MRSTRWRCEGILRGTLDSQRSCTEVKSQLYVALDQRYITAKQFDHIYELAEKTHGKIGGFLKYLSQSQASQRRTKNQER